jgi:acetolactate synthase I/II/III large subunit
MTVSDYIFHYLKSVGVDHVFIVVGGGSMYLNNSLKNSGIKYTCFHHEQSCAMAAEGYARVSGKMAVVLVTSGPGGTNTITGVAGNWTDSVPVLYISGQVKYKTTTYYQDTINDFTYDFMPYLRQLGDQEVCILDLVRPITKCSYMITETKNIRYQLQRAIHFATSGRPGPVWLDIPIDVQCAEYEDEHPNREYKFGEEMKQPNFHQAIMAICESQRPLLVAGHGIRLSKCVDDFKRLVNQLNIPVVTTFNGQDLLPTYHPKHIGHIGTVGTRAGNIALQNADCVIFLGTRNNIRQISYNWENYCPNAKRIIVDIDEAELNKHTMAGDNILLNCDVFWFIKEMMELENQWTDKWLNWCKEKQVQYPVVFDSYRQQKGINPYHFIEELTKLLPDDAIVVSSNGTACVALFQAGVVKENSRFIMNSGIASMGYGLPAAIGACIASGNPVVCIDGDGSLQMNIQELATIRHYNLPIKIFVLNNGGYHSIKETQDAHFDGNYIGCNELDLTFPDLYDIGNAYGVNSEKINNINTAYCIRYIMNDTTPLLCEVELGDYTFAPKLSSYKINGKLVAPPLDDMSPRLSEEERKGNEYI